MGKEQNIRNDQDKTNAKYLEEVYNRVIKSAQTKAKAQARIDTGKILYEDWTSFMRSLAKYGWYVSGHLAMPDFVELTGDKKLTASKVNSHMINLYRNDIARIESDLIEKYPDRREILKQTFQAHMGKSYFLSVPVFLSQADGICRGKLFINSGKKKELRKLVIKDETLDLLKAWLTVITETNTIDNPGRKKPMDSNELNRHLVLHGMDTGYGTESNSLKALSLLCFVSDFGDRKPFLPWEYISIR